MVSTQLYALIKDLPVETQKDCEKWLAWRLGTKEGYLLLLYQAMLKDPNWQSVWQMMFPEKDLPSRSPQIPHILRKRASALKKLIEEYLASQLMREDQYSQDLFFLKYLNYYGTPETFRLQLRRMERSYEKEDGDYHFQMGQALVENLSHEFGQTRNKKNYRWNELLDHFEIANRHRFLKFYMAKLNNKKFRGDERLPGDFKLEDLQSDHLVEQSPSLKVMLELCLVLEEKGDHLKLIELFKANYLRFEDAMKQNIFISLENRLSAKAIERGNEADLRARFDFYNWGDEVGILAYGDRISYKRYNCIVTAGIDVEQTDVVLKLMKKYKPMLAARIREDSYRLSEGLCLLAENRLEELISGFHAHKFPNPTYDTIARLLYIQAQYDRGDRAKLENPLRALQITVKRSDKLSPNYQKQTYLKINLFLKLIRTFNLSKLEQLKSKVTEISSHSFRKWMEAKIQARLAGGESQYIS